MVRIRIRSRLESSNQESESIKLPWLRLRNVLFESVILFAYARENLHARFGVNL